MSRYRIGDLAIRAPRDPNADDPELRTTAGVIDRVKFLASAVRRGDMAAEGTVVQLGGGKTALEAILGQRRASALEQLSGGAQRADIGIDPSTGVICVSVAQRSTAPPAVSVGLWS